MADYNEDLGASRDSFMDGSPNKPLQDQLNEEDETAHLYASLTGKTAQDQLEEFQKYKQEQREHLERKLQIQKRLEAMKREYNFLEQLDTKDVAYVQQKKTEQAAILVQRAFRRHKLRKRAILKRDGVRFNDDWDPPTREELEQISANKKELNDRILTYNQNKLDTFYDHISDERKKEIINEVEARRRGQFSLDELQRKGLDKIGDRHRDLMKDWLNTYKDKEDKRHKAHEQIKESYLMSDYLVHIDEDDSYAPESQLPSQRTQQSQISETEREARREEKEARELREARQRMEKIKVWMEIGDNFQREDVQQVKRLHRERLDRYRNRKEWEDYEEDELDLEGDRVLAEIKNFKSEKFFNTNFY